MDTTTEFEISKAVAESFAAKIRRPDKEDNIRIEPLADAPQGQAASEKRPHTPRNEGNEPDRGARRNEKPREERGPNQHGKTVSENGAGFARESGFEKKKRFQGKPTHVGRPQLTNASPARPAFGKKAKKNRGG